MTANFRTVGAGIALFTFAACSELRLCETSEVAGLNLRLRLRTRELMHVDEPDSPQPVDETPTSWLTAENVDFRPWSKDVMMLAVNIEKLIRKHYKLRELNLRERYQMVQDEESKRLSEDLGRDMRDQLQKTYTNADGTEITLLHVAEVAAWAIDKGKPQEENDAKAIMLSLIGAMTRETVGALESGLNQSALSIMLAKWDDEKLKAWEDVVKNLIDKMNSSALAARDKSQLNAFERAVIRNENKNAVSDAVLEKFIKKMDPTDLAVKKRSGRTALPLLIDVGTSDKILMKLIDKMDEPAASEQNVAGFWASLNKALGNNIEETESSAITALRHALDKIVNELALLQSLSKGYCSSVTEESLHKVIESLQKVISELFKKLDTRDLETAGGRYVTDVAFSIERFMSETGRSKEWLDNVLLALIDKMSPIYVSSRGEKGQTVLHWYTRQHVSSKFLLKLIYKMDASAVGAKDIFGETALHDAIKTNADIEVVKRLIDKMTAGDLAVENTDGFDAKHLLQKSKTLSKSDKWNLVAQINAKLGITMGQRIFAYWNSFHNAPRVGDSTESTRQMAPAPAEENQKE